MTRSGKLYENYKVIGNDADVITISYSGGAANIAISDLPSDLQSKYAVQPSTSSLPIPSHIQDSPQSTVIAATPIPSAPINNRLVGGVVQVLPNGILAQQQSDGKVIYIDALTSKYIEGQKIALYVRRAGDFKFVDTYGATQVIEKWTLAQPCCSASSPLQLGQLNVAK